MKKIAMAALAVSLVLFASCQKKQAPAQQPADAAKSAAPAEKAITVRLLTDATGIDDKSYNAAAWRGILSFYGDTWSNTSKRGPAYDVVTAQTQDMYTPTLRQAT